MNIELAKPRNNVYKQAHLAGSYLQVSLVRSVYVSVDVCVFVSVCVCVYRCVYVCVCVCMCLSLPGVILFQILWWHVRCVLSCGEMCSILW